jgi:Cu/Ag efflux protein CusF
MLTPWGAALEPQNTDQAKNQRLLKERIRMKTSLIRTVVMVAGIAFNLASASPVSGDEPATLQKDKIFKGTVAAVDQKEKTISAKDFWGTKIFNIGDSCTVSLEDQPSASLADLRPGQKVEIGYENAQGVPVADRIAQHNLVFTGYINAIDPAKRTLTVKHGGFTRNFALAGDCTVVIKDDNTKALGDLKLGHTVNVIYESANDSLLARRIEQKSPTFAGTIKAIDAETRTVKAKDMLAEKTFHLANGCQIVVGGKLGGSLSDLRIGDRFAFTYEDMDGVLVVDRIGHDTISSGMENAQAMKSN